MSGACFVVTGATSGIGECVARRLMDRGERVFLAARREERLAAAVASAPEGTAAYLAYDLSSPGAAARLARAVSSSFGAVRGFVHCAGFASPAPLGMIDETAAGALFAVHVVFPMLFLGWMARARNHAEGACAVLVSSRSARAADPGNAAYAAAKGAVEGLFATARAELSPRGVRVELVAPSEVDTPMARDTWMRTASPERLAEVRARHPGGIPSPESVAGSIISLLYGGEGECGTLS